MTDKNNSLLKNYILQIDRQLQEYNNINKENELQSNVIKAMNHSLFAGGKRIRPVLVLEFCKMCGGNIEDAISPACAIEMIHTFSLIHDDLPCMDDDDYRRGRPSCHKAFDEATALLAGDALQNLAFDIIANSCLCSEIKVKLIKELAFAVGIEGMIGGQVIDMNFENKTVSIEILKKMYSLKTGALLKCACKMGCITACAGDEVIIQASEYAENMGLAFQIMDDILDVTSTQEELGKPIGSDKENGKNTFVSLIGIDDAEKTVKELTEKALTNLKKFKNNDFLFDFTENLAIRKK